MKSFLAAAMLATSAIVTPAVIAQDAPPPLSAYGELPGVEKAALSPSGKHLVAIVTIKGQRRILMMDDTMKVLRVIGAGDVKVRDLEWVGDEAVLMYSTQTARLNSDYLGAGEKREFVLATVLPLDPKGETKMVFRGQAEVQSMIYGTYGLRQTPKGWLGYFGGIEMAKGVGIGDRVIKYNSPSLFSVNLLRNTADVAGRPPAEGYSRDWLIDKDGETRATFNFFGQTGSWTLLNASGAVLAQGTAPTGNVGLVGFGPSGDSVVYSVFEQGRGETVWYEVPLGGGSAREFAADQDVDRIYKDTYSGRILGYYSDGSGKPSVTFFDKTQEARANKIRAAFSQLAWEIESFTPDLSRAIVRTSGNNDSGTWFLVDTVNLKATAIGYERLGVGAKVGPISMVDYTAADGTKLDGVLTLPPGREAKDLPVVILPHGGPHRYDITKFDWWAQAMASRGYAVFQPNFRGSTNRDDAFRIAGYGEWGGKMQTDISDGLAALAAKGIVDPKRACIVGSSFGGYAALAGVTLQNGLYRCAVAVAPVSDLEDMYNEDTYRDSAGFGSRVFKERFFQRIGARSIWDSRSPLRAAGKADAPVLLIHGKDDTVVPYAHSTRMLSALKNAGKPATLVTLKEEDHWLSRGPTRMQLLEETMAFLETHNPAR